MARALRPGLLIALSATTAAASLARAEDDCGRMVESLVRLHGTLQAVEPVGQRERTLTSVKYTDVRFAAVVAVDRADPSDAFQVGKTYDFGIHSPAQTLGSDVAPGSAVELELNVMHCDGKYRRLLELRRATDALLEFDGTLEVGRTYRARFEWDPQLGSVLAGPLQVPRHHAGGVGWVVPEDGPQLGPTRRTAEATFEVLERETEQVAEGQWRTYYKCAFSKSHKPERNPKQDRGSSPP